LGVGKAADEAAKSERMAVNFIVASWCLGSYGVWTGVAVVSRNDWNASEMKNKFIVRAQTLLFILITQSLFPVSHPWISDLQYFHCPKEFSNLLDQLFQFLDASAPLQRGEIDTHSQPRLQYQKTQDPALHNTITRIPANHI
jgi:hypothetical protein